MKKTWVVLVSVFLLSHCASTPEVAEKPASEEALYGPVLSQEEIDRLASEISRSLTQSTIVKKGKPIKVALDDIPVDQFDIRIIAKLQKSLYEALRATGKVEVVPVGMADYLLSGILSETIQDADESVFANVRAKYYLQRYGSPTLLWSDDFEVRKGADLTDETPDLG